MLWPRRYRRSASTENAVAVTKKTASNTRNPSGLLNRRLELTQSARAPSGTNEIRFFENLRIRPRFSQPKAAEHWRTPKRGRRCKRTVRACVLECGAAAPLSRELPQDPWYCRRFSCLRCRQGDRRPRLVPVRALLVRVRDLQNARFVERFA